MIGTSVCTLGNGIIVDALSTLTERPLHCRRRRGMSRFEFGPIILAAAKLWSACRSKHYGKLDRLNEGAWKQKISRESPRQVATGRVHPICHGTYSSGRRRADARGADGPQ